MKAVYSWGLIIFAGALVACQVPVTQWVSGPAAQKPGTMTVSFQADDRTVVADWNSQITGYQVVLTSESGLPALTASAAAGGTASFPSVTAGTWDVGVTAFNGTAPAGAGSLAGKVLNPGGSLNLIVPVSGTQNGKGGFSLAFTVPVSVSVNFLSAQLYTVPGNVAVGSPLVPALTPVGSVLQGTLAQAGMNSGFYRLEMRFYRGGSASGSPAGTFSEAVNIWDNVTSTAWLDGSGALASQRTFSVSDFNSNNTQLGSLVLTAGTSPLALTPAFTSPVLAYLAESSSPVTFVPSVSAAGQRIQYQQDGGPLTDIPSGSAWTAAVPAAGMSSTLVGFLVTASDRSTTALYQVRIGIPVTGVAISPAALNLTVGGASGVFTSAVAPATAYNPAVTWASDTPGVASVDPTSGTVTPVAPGSAVITATTKDGGFQGSGTVTVQAPGTIGVVFTSGTYQNLTFSPSTLTVPVGQSVGFTPSGLTGAAGWQWFVNGALQAATSSLTFTPPVPGFYTISLTVQAGGVYYSGSVNAVVTN